MKFLGPVTTLDGRLVRPHDIEVLRAAESDAVGATVTKLTRVGFEVRAELRTAGGRSGEVSEPWVQLTRSQAEALALEPGREVWLRTSSAPQTLAVS
nr:TOBE-like domain-containing protein [Kineosporia babensis]